MFSIRPIIAIILAVATLAFGVLVYAAESGRRGVKADRIALSHIKYGMFNVDRWKVIIADIIVKKVNEFEIKADDRPAMKKKIEALLEQLVAEIEQVVRKENDKRGIKGFFRGMAMDLFNVVEDVKKGIPEYADLLVDYLNDPANREQVKEYLIQRFNEFAEKTAGEVDYTEYNSILQTYGAANGQECMAKIELREEILLAGRNKWLLCLVCVALACLVLGWGAEALHTLFFACFMLVCAVFLVLGITLPMIDIEATVSSFSFTLLGESVSFTNQVLFFQSKSILEVVFLLLRRGEVALTLVSLLILSFSVLIPTMKLFATGFALATRRRPASAIGRFLVFKSAKWSMADVMVVAIFMSYIGFNGVINSQLTELRTFSGNVQVFTTNNSTLMVGFYLFTLYCVLGLLLASKVDRILPEPSVP